MKASFYTESILFSLTKGLSVCTQWVPPSWGVAFGSWVGTGVYHLLSRRRRMALASLRAAFGDSYTPGEYQKIQKKMFQHLGMTLMEVAQIPRMDKAYVERWVAVAPGSRERLEAALAKGNGVIFLTGHFGNWELISITGALHGYPTMVLAREQGWPRLNALLTQYRESKGCQVVTKGFPIRQIIRGLEQGRVVGILSDQDGGRNGVLAPFLGRLASTAPGAIALSINAKVPVLPVMIVRRKGPAHTLVVEEPLDIPRGGTLEDRVQHGITAYLNVLERYVEWYPHQWLWLHRRWKSSPQRRILIFSDGKSGHDTQATALAERIETAWKIRTQEDHRLEKVRKSLVRVETASIAYRHPVWRGLTAALASVVPRRFAWADLWLRWSLTPDSYRAIRSAYADFSISCGSTTAPVNLLWAGSIGVRAIQINRSRLPSWRRFHLALIPQHDRPPAPAGRRSGESPKDAPANLLVTDAALTPTHPVDPEQLRTWRGLLQIQKSRQIGLLLGGPARGVLLERAQIQEALESVMEAVDELDAELLVTSSRRTPPEMEDWLHDFLKGHPRCRLLVLVNRQETGGLQNTRQAVPCILGLAQTLVVSGDSISMISECLAQSKQVISFLPRAVGPREPKYHRFLSGLQAQGQVTVTSPDKIGEALIKIVGDGTDSVVQPVPGSEQRDPIVEFLVRWL